MALHLQVVTDFVCPYCCVLTELFHRLPQELEIEYLPWQLAEPPKPRPDTYHDVEHRERYERQLGPVCREIGLDIKLPPCVCPRPYTELAFCGWFFAREQGLGQPYYDRVVRAYFKEEQDIGKIDVLTALAAQVGLEPAAFRAALEQGVYTEQVRAAVRRVRETVQPRVVPTILAGDRRLEGCISSLDELKAWLESANDPQKGLT